MRSKGRGFYRKLGLKISTNGRFLLTSQQMLFTNSKFEIIVLGAGRGGTSLIGALLDAHSDLEIALEEHVNETIVPADYSQKLAQPQKALKAFIKACEADGKASGLRYGNKLTTEQLGFVEDFGRDEEMRQGLVQKLLKDRKIVFITRDGRNCIHSKMERTGADYQTALFYWKHSVDLLRYLEKQDLDLYRFKYEDLLQEPESTLKGVCDFLGLDYQEQMWQGSNSNRISEQYRQPGLDTSKLQVSDDPRIKWQDIEAELRYLGYEM